MKIGIQKLTTIFPLLMNQLILKKVHANHQVVAVRQAKPRVVVDVKEEKKSGESQRTGIHIQEEIVAV